MLFQRATENEENFPPMCPCGHYNAFDIMDFDDLIDEKIVKEYKEKVVEE